MMISLHLDSRSTKVLDLQNRAVIVINTEIVIFLLLTKYLMDISGFHCYVRNKIRDATSPFSTLFV